MGKVAKFIVHELKEAVYPTIFFLVAFHIMAFVKTLLLDAYSVTLASATIATVGAITVAKAILILDSLAIANKFSTKPLIYEVLWKTLLYTVLVIIFRILEELIPLWSKYGDLGTAVDNLTEEVSWPYIFATQIMLVVIIILYNVFTTLDRHFGEGTVRSAMFGE